MFLFTVFLFVAPSLAFQPRSVRPVLDCPDDFTALGEKCYYFSEQELTWMGALSFCLRNSGTLLAELRTRSEIDLVRNYLKLFNEPCTDWWIGGIETQPIGGTFVWFSTYDKISITDWRTGEPNEQALAAVNFGCHPNDVREWYDQPVQYPAPFICEALPYNAINESLQEKDDRQIKPSLNCPSPFEPLGDYCYLLKKIDIASWDQAAEDCQGQGGYLAELESRMEVELVRYYLQAQHQDCAEWSVASVWIGAREIGDTNVFAWASSNETLTSSHWDIDFEEPNNSGAGNVVAMVCSWNFEWFDFVPDTERNYLCEADPIEP